MYKISSQVIDCYDDEKFLISLAVDSAPEFVKNAKLMSHDQREELGDDEYAVVIFTKTGGKLRKYPVNDKAHTWLSCKSFEKTAHKLPESAIKIAATNIYANCLYNNIECPKSVMKFAGEISSNYIEVDESKELPYKSILEKVAANIIQNKIKDDEWGIVIKKAGIESKLYPLNTNENIEAAIDYFEKNANKMLPEYRREFATNIKKHASLKSINTSEKINAYSSCEKGNNIKINLMERRQLVKDASCKDALSKLIKVANNLDYESLVKFIDTFDKEAGIVDRYDKYIKDPYLTVAEKIAFEEDMGLNIRPEDIIEYATSRATKELVGHLPDELIQRFAIEPTKSYKEMSDIQKSVIIKGMQGKL